MSNFRLAVLHGDLPGSVHGINKDANQMLPGVATFFRQDHNDWIDDVRIHSI